MTGYHEGEIAVQTAAGVLDRARRLESLLVGNYVAGRMGEYLARRNLAIITTTDGDGRLWTSPLLAEPGFLQAGGFALAVRALPVPGDPLAELQAGAQIGLITIDFAARRRFRINGEIRSVDAGGFVIAIEQAYGNCPKCIHPRVVDLDPAQQAGGGARRLTGLDDGELEIVARADTFFLGTVHPSRGADCSHRGGEPGFLRAEDGALCWPDYPGNDMFNSFGNLAVDPAAALLVIDFAGRRALHLSGSAVVEWARPGGALDTGRRVRFTPVAIISVAHPELAVSG